MKKFIIIIFIILLSNNIFSQVLEPKGISTDPDNPINPERPEFDGIDYFFDWREPDNI